MCLDDRDCPYRSVCYLNYTSSDPRQDSYCDCEHFYGLNGNKCDELSVVSYFWFAVNAFTLLIGLISFSLTLKSIYDIVLFKFFASHSQSSQVKSSPDQQDQQQSTTRENQNKRSFNRSTSQRMHSSVCPNRLKPLERFLINPVSVNLILSFLGTVFLIMYQVANIYGIYTTTKEFDYVFDFELNATIKEIPNPTEQFIKIAIGFSGFFTLASVAQLFLIWSRVLRHQLIRNSFFQSTQQVKRLEYFCGIFVFIVSVICCPLAGVGFVAIATLILTIMMGVFCGVLFCLQRAARVALEDLERYDNIIMKNLSSVLEEIRKLAVIMGLLMSLLFLFMILYGILAINGWRYLSTSSSSASMIVMFIYWPALGFCLLIVTYYSQKNLSKTYKSLTSQGHMPSPNGRANRYLPTSINDQEFPIESLSKLQSLPEQRYDESDKITDENNNSNDKIVKL